MDHSHLMTIMMMTMKRPVQLQQRPMSARLGLSLSLDLIVVLVERVVLANAKL